ncbi:MAG: low specificity L-threonine aldolase [Vicinamibacterales bacterium]
MNFNSDNVHGVDDAVLDALGRANAGTARAYGYDDLTVAAEARLGELFERDVEAYLVVTGTAANALALSACCQPWDAVVCHAEAHVMTDECGAPELVSGGARLMGVPGPGCKLTPDAVTAMLATLGRGEHEHRPRALSLSQSTELGTIYSVAEVAALAACAHDRGMRVHMDGARFANALVRLDVTPATLTWRAGVDVLSFGLTKNGAMGVEAVVFFDHGLAHDFRFRRKRAGQLVSKGRFLAAQVLALLEDDRWRKNARHANAMADRLAAALRPLPGVRLPLPVEANAVFAIVPDALHAHLQGHGVRYLVWPGAGPGTDVVRPGETFIRLLTSFRTTPAEVDGLVGLATAAA